jgi:uncharacterized membrane protein YadS
MRSWVTEDWMATGLATIAIGLVLLGLALEAPAFTWASATDLPGIASPANLARIVALGALTIGLATGGATLLGVAPVPFAAGCAVVHGLALLSFVVAGNRLVTTWGVEYVAWALAIGLAIGHAVAIPSWLRAAVQPELYVKTGLVVLGTSILFGDVLQAGALGLVQALLVITVVWWVCFSLARRLGVDDELAVMLSSAVSICGVSAAIAACGAIQGDKKKLSYVTTLVLVVAVPMMVLQPWLATQLGLPDLVAGAWLGGTLDTSGSVVAAAALLGEHATKAGVIVKFSQNVLLGVAAFVLAVWWTMRDERVATRPSARVIWERFPKFVLGFLAASLVFSFLLPPAVVAQAKGTLAAIRTAWFGMAFVAIGLDTRLGELVAMGGGRPVVAFVGAQLVNVGWTLVLAHLLFGGVIFPPPALG